MREENFALNIILNLIVNEFIRFSNFISSSLSFFPFFFYTFYVFPIFPNSLNMDGFAAKLPKWSFEISAGH